MSYVSATLGGLYVVRWGAHPEAPDVERYANEVQKARTAHGKPVVGLFIMPPDSVAPDESFRRAQAAKLPEIMSNLAYAVAVFEGGGFVSSLKRSALVAILLLAPKRYPIHVRATVEDALIGKPAGPIDFDAKRACAELHRLKLAGGEDPSLSVSS
jgi:hypothetical protein